MPIGEHDTPRNGHSKKSNAPAAPSGLSRDAARHPAMPGAARIAQLQQLVGNRAVLQMLRASGSSPPSSAGGVIQRSPSYRLPKVDNSDEFDDFKKSTFSDKELEGKEGSDGKFTAVQADKKLPTYFGALKRIFGEDNVNENKFYGTKEQLGDAADRPHSVTASIDMKTTNKDPREPGPVATAIGHFGYEQLDIQEGDGIGRAMDYNGGHLVGYQVLGGPEADQEWNIAPQDENNNKFAYNNTIEEMARKAQVKTNFDYTVELKYSSPNFEVDQNQLVEHGYLKDTDESKPWNIQLPTRIPQHWSAKAVMNGDKGSFGSPTLNESTSPPKKTYEQLSQTMSSPLSHNDRTHTARYMLTYEDGDKKKIEEKDLKSKLSDVRSVHFRMHQEQPKAIDKTSVPDDWKGEKKSDFGSVEKEQITLELVSKLRDDIELELSKLDGVTEVAEDEFDFSTFFQDQIKEVAKEENKQQMVCFGMLVQSNSSMIESLKQQFEDTERMRDLVFDQKEKLKPTKEYRKKLKDKKFDSTMKLEELIKESEELNTHSLNVKRAIVSLDNYNQSLKKRKLEEKSVKEMLLSVKKKATSEYTTLMKEDTVRKTMPTVFSGQRVSNLDKQSFNFYEDKVNGFFTGFPVFPKQDPPGIVDFMKIEDDTND